MLHSHNEQVMNSPAPLTLARQCDSILAGELFLITGGSSPALLRPLWEVLQLYSQNAGLDRVQAAIVAFNIMIIFLRLTVIAKPSDFLSQIRIVGGDRAGFSAGAQILTGIKAESG